MNKLTLFALSTAFVAACSASRHYGAPVPASEPVKAVTLLHHPELFEGKTVVLEAQLAEVCPVKGCWAIVRDGERELRVTFKDYGFFLPLDSAGSIARMEGEFRVVEMPADLARHYLEDAGKHDEAAVITAPVRSATFVASGVELRAR